MHVTQNTLSTADTQSVTAGLLAVSCIAWLGLCVIEVFPALSRRPLQVSFGRVCEPGSNEEVSPILLRQFNSAAQSLNIAAAQLQRRKVESLQLDRACGIEKREIDAALALEERCRLLAFVVAKQEL